MYQLSEVSKMHGNIYLNVCVCVCACVLALEGVVVEGALIFPADSFYCFIVLL